MQPKAALAALAVVGGLAALAFRATPELGVADLKTGDKAPAFTATSLAGQQVSLANLTKSGPVFLYFIKSDCPINAQALPHFKKIAAAYKGKGPIVGVINEAASGAKRWQTQNSVSFPLVLDPDYKIIRPYQAQASPWMIEVKKDGKVGKVWTGYSQGSLDEINRGVASGAGAPVAKLDFSSAPRNVRYG